MTTYCGRSCPSKDCFSTCNNYLTDYSGPGGRYKPGTLSHYQQWKDLTFGCPSTSAQKETRENEYRLLKTFTPRELLRNFETKAHALEEVIRRKSCCQKLSRVAECIAREAGYFFICLITSGRSLAVARPKESPHLDYEKARLMREYVEKVRHFLDSNTARA